jgi:Zn-finger nucleic acid-binding protein
MAYRDEHERCPRCGTDLIDAVVGLACVACRGLWVSPADVEEMAINMQIPPGPVELPLTVDGNREKLACPTCREGMDLFSIFQVQIDVCETHGIWFDANELAQVLLRAARST